MRIVCLVLLGTLTGCQSAVVEGDVAADRVLVGPYDLRLAVAPTTARPGERVKVSVEFQNTGTAPLWIPRGREVFLGYRQDGSEGETWSSSCDGIRYLRLQPGAKVCYEQSFEVPNLYGTLEIYTTVRRQVSVPLQVERPGQPSVIPIQSPDPSYRR